MSETRSRAERCELQWTARCCLPYASLSADWSDIISCRKEVMMTSRYATEDYQLLCNRVSTLTTAQAVLQDHTASQPSTTASKYHDCEVYEGSSTMLGTFEMEERWKQCSQVGKKTPRLLLVLVSNTLFSDGSES